MTDREKYIEVLSKTVKTVKEYNEDAPIKISLVCIEDILELLKEHEPKLAISGEAEDLPGIAFWVCPSCRIGIDYLDRFCRHCGQEMKWE